MAEGLTGRGLRIRIMGVVVVVTTAGRVWAGVAETPPPASAAEAQRHWAYRPVVRPPVPDLSPVEPSQALGPLDAHVLGALKARGLTFSERADRSTLIRRVYFDLIGIPPTAEAVAAFVADPSGDDAAMERLVDALLADPRFGERWARYWLDVARYADSKGYVFQEERRYAYSYTYRDWVIRAFNEDLPYDKFILAQLAADQTLGKEDPRHLAAMGFLTLGRRFLNNPHDIIDDRLDVIFRGLQATTISCARCHDHKFDPIPTADYYSLYGVFASSEEPKEKPLLGEPERTPEYLAFEAELQKKEKAVADFYESKKQDLFKEELLARYLDTCLDGWERDDDGLRALAKERQLYPSVAVRWRTLLKQLGADHPVAGLMVRLVSLPGGEWGDRGEENLRPLLEWTGGQTTIVAAWKGERPGSRAAAVAVVARLLASSQSDQAVAATPALSELKPLLSTSDGLSGIDAMSLGADFSVPERDRARSLRNEVEEFKATAENGPPRAMAMIDRTDPVDPVIFKRGSPGNRGDTVPRQFLGVLSGAERKPFTRGSGRLELAETIASPANPLTARVYANRVWLWLTGQSLVDSPSDFGVRTPPPSNPALLDHLASSLMENGWSTKRLIREILLSRAWQQTSQVATASRGPAVDPENTLMWKMNRRRRDFESFRDSLLAVSGRLDPKTGGRPVPLDDPEARRRTIYGFIDRQNLPGLFRSFDFASPDQHAPKRHQTTVPQQALFALNNPFVLVQARALATPSGATETERAAAIFRRVLSREPEAAEQVRAAEFVSTTHESQTAGAWEYGTGMIDPGTGAVRFEAFDVFSKDRWTHRKDWPEPEWGHAVVQKSGGHPGGDASRAVIWRWRSSVSGSISLSGGVKRPSAEGDGVHLSLVTSSGGLVRSWDVPPGGEIRLDGTVVGIRDEDVMDLIVDPMATDHSDSVTVSIELRSSAGAVLANTEEEFSGPALDPWVAYAQVLLISNEFMFVD